MFRSSLTVVLGFLIIAVVALAAAVPEGSELPARAARFIATYEKSTNVTEKLRALRGLEAYPGTEVDDFIMTQYGDLDGTDPQDAQLLGGIFRLWAARPKSETLPYLIYEGLMHEDAAVVRDCAEAIGRMPEEAKAVMSTGTTVKGKDPGEDLATDLIERMGERADVMAPLEKTLAIWSGKARPGFKPKGNLKRIPDEKERAASLEFWKGWYSLRFKKPFDASAAPQKSK